MANRNYKNSSSRNREPSKARTALGVMFNPSFGTSFSMLRETGRMFIHLLAMIFAQANLLDKRHPAVLGTSDKHYNLFDIIQLAYERVEWRQENMAQISMFLAVCACIAICALGVVYALFSIVFSTV